MSQIQQKPKTNLHIKENGRGNITVIITVRQGEVEWLMIMKSAPVTRVNAEGSLTPFDSH